jgi:hypothetical protein
LDQEWSCGSCRNRFRISDSLQIACPRCRGVLLVTSQDIGQQVPCQHCGNSFLADGPADRSSPAASAPTVGPNNNAPAPQPLRKPPLEQQLEAERSRLVAALRHAEQQLDDARKQSEQERQASQAELDSLRRSAKEIEQQRNAASERVCTLEQEAKHFSSVLAAERAQLQHAHQAELEALEQRRQQQVEALENRIEALEKERDAARQPQLKAFQSEAAADGNTSWRWPGKAMICLVGAILGILGGMVFIIARNWK